MRVIFRKHLLAVGLLCSVLYACSWRLDAYTDTSLRVHSYQSLNLPAQADVRVGIPFRRAPASIAVVNSVGDTTIEVAQAAANWAEGEFAADPQTGRARFYALLDVGELAGVALPVAGNSAYALTIDTALDLSQQVSVGTVVTVVAYWTLDDLINGGLGVGFQASSAHANRAMELLLADPHQVGVPLSAYQTFYLTAAGWRVWGGGLAVDMGQTPLLPGTGVVIRNNTDGAREMVLNGSLQLGAVTSIPIRKASESRDQDNWFGPVTPMSMSLSESGLYQSSVFMASSSHSELADRLLVFDDTVDFNPEPSAVYYYYSGTPSGWRLTGDSLTIRDDEIVFYAARSFVLRKKADGVSETLSWKHSVHP
jgi:uncharacterized protein (TIGR02597 family)